MSQKQVVKKMKTHILYSKFFFRKSCLLWDNVENFVANRQATGDNKMRRKKIHDLHAG